MVLLLTLFFAEEKKTVTEPFDIEKETFALAKLISEAIGTVGLDPQWLENALNQFGRRVWNEAIERAAQRCNDGSDDGEFYATNVLALKKEP